MTSLSFHKIFLLKSSHTRDQQQMKKRKKHLPCAADFTYNPTVPTTFSKNCLRTPNKKTTRNRSEVSRVAAKKKKKAAKKKK